MPSPQNFTITIVVDAPFCRAIPSELMAAIDDNVTFLNLSNNPVTVLFPAQNPFGIKKIELDARNAGKDSVTLPILQVDYGAYYYDVYDHGNGFTIAKGTQPIIIVYPG